MTYKSYLVSRSTKIVLVLIDFWQRKLFCSLVAVGKSKRLKVGNFLSKLLQEHLYMILKPKKTGFMPSAFYFFFQKIFYDLQFQFILFFTKTSFKWDKHFRKTVIMVTMWQQTLRKCLLRFGTPFGEAQYWGSTKTSDIDFATSCTNFAFLLLPLLSTYLTKTFGRDLWFAKMQKRSRIVKKF